MCLKNTAFKEVEWHVLNDRDGKADVFRANVCLKCALEMATNEIAEVLADFESDYVIEILSIMQERLERVQEILLSLMK
jgi:hypothetical protein